MASHSEGVALWLIFAGSGLGFVMSGLKPGLQPHFGVGAARMLLAKASTGRRIKVDRMVERVF